MLSINTNLSSLIAQNSMQTSTNKLNQAVERMTTGAKINHAKDNAANYSINTNMTTKIGAYRVAEENTAMGMDMVQTASENLDQMQNHATRLRALATQARNGTYGAQSLEAIQSEANAITKEIERLYNTAQYNGVKLFSRKEYEIAPHLPQAGKSGFIDESAFSGTDPPTAKYNGFIENPVTYTDSRLAEMLASGDLVVLETDLESFTSGKSYLIKDKAQLEHLAELVNQGKSSTNVTFILGADIDLKNEEWTPIGDYSTSSSYTFKGIFDGNGHVIKNLKIDSTEDYQGLFGLANGAEIKNVSLEGGHVEGNSRVGFLVGSTNNSTITNSYSTGDVTGQGDHVGGLVGFNSSGIIANSYATGFVSGQRNFVGGLVGTNCYTSSITNCFATGNIIGQNYVGGLVASNNNSSIITNSYALGNVTGQRHNVGGLIGVILSPDTNMQITGCVAYGAVNSTSQHSGSLIGSIMNSTDGVNFTDVTITNCEVIPSDKNVIGTVTKNGNVIIPDYDMSEWLNEIKVLEPIDISTNLQVGVHGNSSSRVNFNTNFKLDLSAFEEGISSDGAFSAIDDFINLLSEKSTMLGSVSNRLDSVLDEITIQYENLVSSRSTIRDVDMAEVSSTYIQQQILQEASATLLSTTKNIQYQNVLGLLQGLRS